MVDYLAYLWAQDITEETVGDRRSLLPEVLDVRRGTRGRGRMWFARTLRVLADALEPSPSQAPRLRRNP